MSINDLHKKSMDIAENAVIAKYSGILADSQRLFSEAFQLESEAANQLDPRKENEPTRTILFRSAASLAMQADMYEEAERHIYSGLIGFGPNGLRDELKDLLEQLSLERHLKLHGLRLSPDEFQLTLAGPSIGYGMAKSDEFIKRIEIIEKMEILFEKHAQNFQVLS